MNWSYDLASAYEIDEPCPACGGILKRWRCRAFCMDCQEIVHYSHPLKASGWKYGDVDRV